ncbi:M16 family metallopeptidase [Qipengyuania marisflavi]|uniref:Insulinase family protein n=1 Tax=Qipengyuania marisflavi TaxID=2486356 RepID=A0A5S3NY65_9SPHN|nr:pitrilysin family protein [Qipengyuania marisflavi]TMM45324.1 insulinase family protein [Qipengyuania marisflavi]
MLRSVLAAGVATLAFVAVPASADKHTAAAALSAPQIEFTEWTLANGLRVIAIEDDSTATVTTSLWYEVGSKHDPEGRSGFAHLFEHILSRKTENMPYNLIYGLTADIGGTRNASTNADRTNYYETVPAEYLEQMLWTHRERMFKPVIDQDVFDKERDVVKEELRQRVYAPPYGRLQSFVLGENAYDVLPQRRPTIGSIEDLDTATLDDARAFHQAYYGPDTATLIVAGNFDEADLRKLVDSYFADIPRRANPVSLAITAKEPQRTQPRSVVATAPTVPLPVAGSLWKAPGSTGADAAALDVLAAIMARGENSRLNEALIRTGKAVGSEFVYAESEEGGFVASFAITNPLADVEEVDAILKGELAKVRTEPVTAAELSEAKSEMFAAALSRRETARGRAFELGEALVSSGDPQAADRRLAQIGAVTAADVMRVANSWLQPNARVDLRYVAGEDDPQTYANPVPMPTFVTLPSAIGEPRSVLPDGERQEPPAPGVRPTVTAPAIVESTLANGIEVVATQTGTVPLATMTVIVPGGAISDPREKAGIAAFAAALANRGTPTMTAQQIAARLESLGASFGAGGGTEGSFFSLTAPVANMAEAGKILSAMIREANYPEDEFERERKRGIDGLALSLKDPGQLVRMAALPVFYGDAPYGTIAGGTQTSLAAITRDDLLTHRQTWWHPQATKIVVSGGIAQEAAVALTNQLFGNWRAEGPAPQSINGRAGTPRTVRTVVIDMPDAGQAAIYAGMRAPSRASDDFFPLTLANAVLGGGSSGRLFEEVRTKRSISYGAGSGVMDRADDGYLVASAQTQNSTADEVVQVFLDEFDRLGREAFADDLIAKRRLFLTGGYSRALESSSGFNNIVAGLMLQGLKPAEAARYADRLATVTPQQASQVAARYVAADKATLVIVGNAAEFLDDLKKIRPNVEVISADDLVLSREDLVAGQ